MSDLTSILLYELYLERRIREYCLMKLEDMIPNVRDLWSFHETELRRAVLTNGDIITNEEAYNNFVSSKCGGAAKSTKKKRKRRKKRTRRRKK